jgi:hypothetical protein
MIPHLSLSSNDILGMEVSIDKDREWLYRLDHYDSYRRITDGSFRMRKWEPSMRNRSQLLPLFRPLTKDMGLYRICFFPSWADLLHCTRWAVSEYTAYVFTRVPVSILEDLSRARDEEFLADQNALIFTRFEPVDPQRAEWSSFAIPITATQQLHADGRWQSPAK